VIGQTVSHYDILEKLGEGGMGVVYKARDTKLNRVVALKFLPQRKETSSEEGMRLLQEARAAARLNHPNIATVFEFDVVDSPKTGDTHTFIAMEYVEGESLKTLIRRGVLTIPQVESIVTQLARALSVAHSKGIVHRDLKPANILITNDGTAKILDFGVAKLLGETTFSKSGDIIGTVAYMSPEQLQGGTIDARCDIWALGVATFEMLTRRLPFKGEHTPALMYSITNQEPLNLKELRPDVPDKLLTVCTRALQKNPDDRFQSMGELLTEIGDTASAQLAASAPHRLTDRTRRILIAMIGISAIAVVSWFLATTSRKAGPNTATAEKLIIGVLKFENLSKSDETTDWPRLIQDRFAEDFRSRSNVGVKEPNSLNGLIEESSGKADPVRGPDLYRILSSAGISKVLDGALIRLRDQFQISFHVVNPGSYELEFSDTAFVKNERELFDIIPKLSSRILVKLLSGESTDFKPWLITGTTNFEAFKEFERASDCNFKGMAAASDHNKRAIELDSTFIAPRIWLISGLVKTRKFREAEKHYAVLLALSPKASPFLQEMIGWAGAKIKGDSLSEEHHLQNALEYSQGDNVLLTNLGSLRCDMGNYAGALKALLPVADTKWKNSTFYFELARCYALLKRYAEAKKTLENALSIEPVYHQIYGLLAVLARIDGDVAMAEQYERQCFEEARSLGRTPDRGYADLGRLYLVHGIVDQAIRCFRAAIALKGEFPQYYDGLAEALYRKGEIHGAAMNYERALTVDSTWINSHWLLGQIHEASGERNQAVKHYKAYLKQDSTGVVSMAIKQRLLRYTN
jgi:serine/threonine protein kinase/tetratricopeptide (TPR) repeat protein